MRSGLVAVLAAAWVSASGASAAPPAAAFGRAPQVQEVAISRDGQRLAVLGGLPDDRTLAIATIDRPEMPALHLGKVSTSDVRWVGDYAIATTRYPFTPKGAPTLHYMLERNVAVDGQAKVISYLLEHDEESKFLVQHTVVGVSQGPPARALVLGLLGGELTVWRVDPRTGGGQRVSVGHNTTSWFEVDASGEPRVRRDRDYFRRLIRTSGRAKGANTWKLLLEEPDTPPGDEYVGYSDPEDAAVVWRYRGTEKALVRARLSGAPEEVVWRAAQDRPATLLWDTVGQQLVGVAAGAEAQPQTTWFDADLGAVQARLAQALHSPDLRLEAWSADRSRFVVRTVSPDAPSAWYLFDRSRKEISPLGEAYPELKAVELGHTSFQPFTARDGQQIPAYLTLPPKPVAGAKPPLVVLPRYVADPRDLLQFDYLTEFLASRGYAVLRPVVRGSGGLGPAYSQAGVVDWGGKMQSDMLDAVAHLAKDGLVDTTRTCIMGWDVGGFVALTGALDPHAYRCAVAINAVSDPATVNGRDLGRFGADVGYGLQIWVGTQSRVELARISAVGHAEHAAAPILLVHADQDDVVPISQSRMMQAALQKAQKPVEFLVLAGDDHELSRSATRTQMLEAVEKFLRRHLEATP